MLVAAAPLSACSPIDVFGPRPDAQLVSMARQAEADAETLEGPVAEMRGFHARQLYDEISRLCGLDPQGQPPSSCEVERGLGEAVGAKDPAAAAAVVSEDAVAERVPADSKPLVVAQAIDLAAASDTALNVDSLDNEELKEVAAGLISEEFAVQFGLDLASAYCDDATQERIDALRPLHDERIDALRTLFPELPQRAPGYEVDGGGPTDVASAASFVDTIESTLVARYRSAAADAFTSRTPDEWRRALIQLAAHAQRSAQA